MTPEERDELAELCADACATEGGERLWSALITDCLMGRIVAQHPDPGGLADELGPAKIVDVARRELADLTDAEKEELRALPAGSCDSSWRLSPGARTAP